METMKLTLTGKNETGSDIYRSYFLVTDGGTMAGKGRASAIPMTGGAPMPEPEYVEVCDGGEEKAISLLVATVLALPGNQGLIAALSVPS